MSKSRKRGREPVLNPVEVLEQMSKSRKRRRELELTPVDVLQQLCAACANLDDRHVKGLLKDYDTGIINNLGTIRYNYPKLNGILNTKPFGHVIEGFLDVTYYYYMNNAGVLIADPNLVLTKAEFNNKKEATKRIMRMLLEKGATIDCEDAHVAGQQSTYLHNCLHVIITDKLAPAGQDDRAFVSQQYRLLHIFLSIRLLDPTVVDFNGNTILHVTCQYYLVDALKILLNPSYHDVLNPLNPITVLINKTNPDGKTPLITALCELEKSRKLNQHGYLGNERDLYLICEKLIDSGANVDIVTNSKRSAFMYACDIKDRHDQDGIPPEPNVSLLREKIFENMETTEEDGIKETPSLHNIVFHECSICLNFLCDNGSLAKQELVSASTIRTVDPPYISILPCGHMFHAKCIRPWIHANKNCALCRQPTESKDIHVLFKHDDGIVKTYINNYLKTLPPMLLSALYENFKNPPSRLMTHVVNPLSRAVGHSISALRTITPDIRDRVFRIVQDYRIFQPPAPAAGHMVIPPPPPGPGGRSKQNNTKRTRSSNSNKRMRKNKRKTARR